MAARGPPRGPKVAVVSNVRLSSSRTAVHVVSQGCFWIPVLLGTAKVPIEKTKFFNNKRSKASSTRGGGQQVRPRSEGPGYFIRWWGHLESSCATVKCLGALERGNPWTREEGVSTGVSFESGVALSLSLLTTRAFLTSRRGWKYTTIVENSRILCLCCVKDSGLALSSTASAGLVRVVCLHAQRIDS